MQVLIGGVDRTSIVDLSTLRIRDAIGERSTCSFLVNDLDNSLATVLVPGAAVEIEHEAATVFGGTIDSAMQTKVGSSATRRQYQVECVDWHQLCDRHIVAETYESTLAGDIVEDIITTYLAADGIASTVPSVQDGPTILEAVFNYVSATACLDSLAEKAGFVWWVDQDKVLHFVERATYASPWGLDDPQLVEGLRVAKNRDAYRNRQYIKAGRDVTDAQVESFIGNGVSRSWTVGYPIAKVPTVKLNTVAQTVGIKGIDTGKAYYWNKDDPVVTQDPGGVLLLDTDTLEVTYQGFFDIIVLTTDDAAIQERIDVEGGSGQYDAVDDEPYLTSLEAAIQSGNAKLSRFANITKAITFDTYTSGLRAGQILTVTLSDRGLDEEFLIEEVTFSQIGGDHWNYAVRAVSGEGLGSWTKFFRMLAGKGDFIVRQGLGEEQVLIVLVQPSEGWDWAEGAVVTVLTCPLPGAAQFPSPLLYPC